MSLLIIPTTMRNKHTNTYRALQILTFMSSCFVIALSLPETLQHISVNRCRWLFHARNNAFHPAQFPNVRANGILALQVSKPVRIKMTAQILIFLWRKNWGIKLRHFFFINKEEIVRRNYILRWLVYLKKDQ